MPLHSSKNIHRADFEVRQEQLDWEENDKDYRQDIYNMVKIMDTYTECGDRTHWYDSVYDLFSCRDYSAFDDYWVYEIHNPVRARSWRRLKRWCWRCNHYDCICSFHFCSCDMCYEFVTTKRMEEKFLVKKYFSPQEIYDTNEMLMETHRQSHPRCHLMCTCGTVYWKLKEEGLSPFLPSEVYKHLLSGGEGCKAFEPQEINMNLISPCTVGYLYTVHGKRVKELHDQRELKEKCELLAKYGVTLQEYRTFRIERQLQLEQKETPSPKPEEPKQKFYRVKESSLKTGDFSTQE